MYIEYNPNPLKRRVGDCAVRAVAKALNISWEQSYAMLTAYGYQMGDIMNSDAVWGAVLRVNGFYKDVIPDKCPECYTAEDFCKDHRKGTYVLGFSGHCATVVDGNLYDAWDSSNEIPHYYWIRRK